MNELSKYSHKMHTKVSAAACDAGALYRDFDCGEERVLLTPKLQCRMASATVCRQALSLTDGPSTGKSGGGIGGGRGGEKGGRGVYGQLTSD